MAGYGWEKYDPRHGGIQTIHDAGNQVDITTSFTKSADGQNWGLRVSGKPRSDAPADLKTTVIFYAAVEMQGLSTLQVQGGDDAENELGYSGDVVMNGENPNIGDFKIVVKADDAKGKNKHPVHSHASASQGPLDKTFVRSGMVPEEGIWQTKPILFAAMKEQIDTYIEQYGEENLPPPFQLYTLKNEVGAGNVQLVQKVFEGAFEFDILFTSGSSAKELTSEDLTSGLKSATESFDKRFKELFKPQGTFSNKKYLEFSESLFSNLLGGIGYFYGDWKVDRSYAPEYEEENEGFWEEAAEARSRVQPQTEGPLELFTSIPSRPFFPRGFFWDEGFHLIPVLDWDVDLTLQIVKSWFNLMDEDGWIAREQILGPEARSKVPPEFQVQYPHYANPPTLFFILTDLIDKLEAASKKADSIPSDPEGQYYPQLRNQDSARQYLKELYPLLKRNYEWFRRTQQGDLKTYEREAFSTKEGYRWRGRTPQHILTSGLDDYPRAQPPHPGELHVDAISWVGAMSRALKQIASYLGEEEDLAKFTKQETAIKRNIADLHWSEKDGVHCDATIDEFEESILVCRKGYISLFPFMLGLLDGKTDSAKIKAILKVLGDPEELWSNHGIRSLSQTDESYGTEENYWRSPVWINMNYLIVKQLLVCPSIVTKQSLKPNTDQTSLSRKPPIPTKKPPQSCTPRCARTSSTRSTIAGRTRASRGSSITLRRARVSAPSISRAGRAWLLRFWRCPMLVVRRGGMSCR